MKIFKWLLIFSLALAASPFLQNQGWTQMQDKDGAKPTNVPRDASDILRKALKYGTPSEKEAALDVIRDLKPIKLIPEIIEAIEDPTPLPRHEDTGWGFVGHQAATVMGEIARAIDGVDTKPRGNGYDAYSFYNDQYKGGQKLKEIRRLSEVRSNWAKWWQAFDNK